MPDAADNHATPNKSQQTPLRTATSATHLNTHRSATASPTTHLGDRTPTRKASRRDLVIGSTDNIGKQSPLQPLQHRRSGNLVAGPSGQQARSMSVNPTAVGQGEPQQRRGSLSQAAMLAQQQRSMTATPTVGQRHQEMLRRSMLAASAQGQQQQRGPPPGPPIAQREKQRGSPARTTAAQRQQQRGPPPAPPAAQRPLQLRPSSNPAAGQGPPQQFRRTANPAAVSASLQREIRQFQDDSPVELTQKQRIDKMIEGFHMVVEHVIRERGISREEAAWALDQYMQRCRDRVARGLPPFAFEGEIEKTDEELEAEVLQRAREDSLRGHGRGGEGE
ncbi:hypothetical protein LTR85_000916 [Meristemomyces frigidus]|nr:hypothetical protein LTR85_000916 [Meristemomyces frigidus]